MMDVDADSLGAAARQAEQDFAERYGRPPQFLVAAPGRVNLIGEHTDYNDGFVLPMAIARYVVIAAAAPSDPPTAPAAARFYSTNFGQSVVVPLTDGPPEDGASWSRYPAGVCAIMRQRGHAIPAFDALIQSSVPVGGGLSSSAALEVATATLLEAMLQITLDPVDKALLCQQAEHRYAGVPCGIMDQFSSVFGQENALMLLDCRTQQIQLVPFQRADVTLLITNSNVSHSLAGGEYAQRREQCQAAADTLGVSSLRDVTGEQLESARAALGNILYRRARHVVTEIERTVQAAEAIQQGDWAAVGQRMYASHQSLRDDYEVSCPELDCLVHVAQEIGSSGGVIGARMTGGGFGGCTVTLVRSDAVAEVSDVLRRRYQQETGIEPQLFASRPARGAHRLQLSAASGAL